MPPWGWGAAAAAIAAIVALIVINPFGGGNPSAPAPKVHAPGTSAQAKASAELGFPGFATKDTTRVGGGDAASDAAGVAAAVFPGVEQRPQAVALVPNGNWQAGIAASVLMAPPARAPLLVSGPGDVPSSTQEALNLLDPIGGDPTDNKQAFAVGGAKVPKGLRAVAAAGSDPATMAAAVDALRGQLASSPEPAHILVVSADSPAYSMPAAGWAARSGDPVLFVNHNDVPEATASALKRHRGVPVYVLGPEAAVSSKAMTAIVRDAPTAKRISGPDPVSNAIAFAKYHDGTFGWNINDPGHGLVIANQTRPQDAGAAAALSASGTYGPLLLVESSDVLPETLRNYLLDIKPGYKDDPTRAFYNHAWLIGDPQAISIGVQGQLDALLELAPVGQSNAPTQAPSGAGD